MRFSEALEPDERRLEAFDKGFPPKERRTQASQAAFEQAVREIDTNSYD